MGLIAGYDELLELYIKLRKAMTEKRDDLPDPDSKELVVREMRNGRQSMNVCFVKDDKITIALKFGKISEEKFYPDYPQNEVHLLNEIISLGHFLQMAPGCSPKVLYYHLDEKNGPTLFLEHLAGFKQMRWHMARDGIVDEVANQTLARNLARVHAKTHRITLPEADFKMLRDDFQTRVELRTSRVNMLCDDPYVQKDYFTCSKAVKAEAKKRIYDNKPLRSNVTMLRKKLLEQEDCLVHGNLHPGVIMVKDGVPKIFNNDYSFVGPIAFDLGILFAHFIISYTQHNMIEGKGKDKGRHVARKVVDGIKDIATCYLEVLHGLLPGLPENFDATFFADVAGICALQLIARTIERTLFFEIEEYKHKEVALLDSAIKLLERPENVVDVGSFLMIALQES